MGSARVARSGGAIQRALPRFEEQGAERFSRGVSLWFCTQNPPDIPPKLLGQLGHRVRHAMPSGGPQPSG
jgi:hypothetical protein